MAQIRIIDRSGALDSISKRTGLSVSTLRRIIVQQKRKDGTNMRQQLTQQQIESMSAAQLAAYFREQARAEIARKKEEKANAEKFEAIALPHIEAGRSFDDFMRLTSAPASFRSAYERLQTKYRVEHQPTPEEAERLKLEREVQAAMGISSDDPQQQAEPTGYQGRDYFSAWAQYSQSQQDKQRRFVGGMSAASESPAEPEEPDGDDSSPEDDPETPDDAPTSPEDDPTSPEQPEEPGQNDTPSEG